MLSLGKNIAGDSKVVNFGLERLTLTPDGTAEIDSSHGESAIFARVCADLGISYVLDVAKGKVAAANLTTIALYISFFPTVVSGPITKARDLLPQLGAPRAISSASIAAGVQQFIIGYLKKFVVADNLAPFVNAVYQAPGAYDTPTVWLAVISFSLQLYFDFAGYPDMAIGVARTLGLQLAENFNMPYLAKSVSEFWKRWHISLSSWLQEYLYFSLGGSRVGRLRTFINLLLTMTICGLWHGAAMTFVVWGFLHGVLLCLQRIYRDGLGARLTLPAPFSIALTFLSVTLCWIFFRASSLENALAIFERLFIPQMEAVFHPFVLSFVALAILLVMVVCTIRHENYRAVNPVVDLRRPLGFFIVCLELYALFALRYAGDNPFIYAAF